MPSDIRAFFGGKPTAPAAPAPKEPEKTKKRGRPKKIVDDDEDEEDEVPKKAATPAKKRAKVEPEPELEETTASDYFGKGNRPKRSEPVRPAAQNKTAAT